MIAFGGKGGTWLPRRKMSANNAYRIKLNMRPEFLVAQETGGVFSPFAASRKLID